MYAKTTIFQFRPDAIDEGTRIVRDIMIPSASEQRGFKGAFMLRKEDKPDQHIVVSLWETKTLMQESHPPEAVLPLLEPLTELIVDQSQDICEVLLYVNK